MKKKSKEEPKTKAENTAPQPAELTSAALSAVCGGSIERQHTPQQRDEQVIEKSGDRGSGKTEDSEFIEP